MKDKFYKVIKFTSSDTKNGVLYMYQKGDDTVPFDAKKVLFIKGMSGNDKRGAHTHHKTNQILICLSGACTVDLDNGKKKTSVKLSRADEGLLLYPYVWHVMHSFEPDTSLLVIADREYDEKEYIRNYEDFLRFAKDKISHAHSI